MAALTAKRCPRLMSPCRLGSVPAKISPQGIQNTDSHGTADPVHQVSKHVHSSSDKTQSDVLGSIRKQIRNVSKLRDNLANAVTYLGAIQVEVPNPGRYLPDYQKYIPSISFQKRSEKETDRKLNDSEKHDQQNEMKTVVKSQKESELRGSEEVGSFHKAMTDTHESVHSFCTSAGTLPYTEHLKNLKSSDKTPSRSEESDREEDSILSMFAKAYKIIEPSNDKASEKVPLVRKDFVSRAAVTHRTKSLVQALKNCSTDSSHLVRTEDLCKHLLDFPEAKSVATKEGVLPTLLRLRRCPDNHVKAAAREALALLGYTDPVKGRGIRILTVDGGGTKGLVAIETLKKLEEACKTDITELFDFVCGVSTGALILAMVFMFHVPLDQCEHLYKELSTQMFTRNKFVGTGKLVWNHAFYDTEIWEKILKENLGESLMIDLARDPQVPKMACFSCLMNAPKLKNFIFRNYNLPPEVFSQFPGNCKHKVWEAIRASSAAPGYYEECKLGDFIHQDGGLLTNNPTALGIHEGKLLWPQESIQCVISLGNGRHEPSLELSTANKVTLKDKVSKIVDSATDTEAVHTTLQDLMAPSTYYRFNPYLSEEFLLDEIRPEKQESMQRDTQMYLRKNDVKIQRAARQLLLARRPHQKTADWLKHRADMM